MRFSSANDSKFCYPCAGFLVALIREPDPA